MHRQVKGETGVVATRERGLPAGSPLNRYRLAVAAPRYAAEAVAAVDRPARGWLERHLGRLTTVAADDVEHLARCGAAGNTPGATSDGTAIGATAGLVGQAFGRIKLLLTSCERELLTAVTAGKRLVLKAHARDPPNRLTLDLWVS